MKDQERRDHGELERNERRRQQQHQHHARPTEPDPSERIPGEAAEHELCQHGRAGHDQAVQEPAREVGVGEDGRVAPRVETVREDRGGNPIDLTVGHERRQHHPDERQDHDDRQWHQHEMPSLGQTSSPAAPPHPSLGLLDARSMDRDVDALRGRQRALADHSAIPRRRPYMRATKITIRLVKNRTYATAAP